MLRGLCKWWLWSGNFKLQRSLRVTLFPLTWSRRTFSNFPLCITILLESLFLGADPGQLVEFLCLLILILPAVTSTLNVQLCFLVWHRTRLISFLHFRPSSIGRQLSDCTKTFLQTKYLYCLQPLLTYYHFQTFLVSRSLSVLAASLPTHTPFGWCVSQSSSEEQN